MAGRMDRSKVVVILEDDANVRRSLVQALEGRGYYAVPVETGLRALQVLQQIRARLLIMDLMLPDMSGDDVIKALREDEKTKDIPLMVLSNHLHVKDGLGRGGDAAQQGSITFDFRAVVDEVEGLIGKPFSETSPAVSGRVLIKSYALG